MYKNGSIEKRRHQRLECSMPVQYKRIGTLRDDLTGALTKNVCCGGTRLVTEDFIPVNSRLVVIISFPFINQKIKSLCKVVWTKRFETLSRYDLGVEFVDMTHKAKKDISIFVKSKLS